MRNLLLVIVSVMFALNAFAWNGMPTPALHVEGRHLINAYGDTVLLHGFAITPNPWFNGCCYGECQWNDYDVDGCLNYIYAVLDKLTDTHQGWYCNMIRLHLDPYWSNLGSAEGENDISKFNKFRFQKYFDEVMVPIIDHAEERGLYVIIRPPGVCPEEIGADDYYTKYLEGIWDYVSTHEAVQNRKHVMLELANEPVKIVSSAGKVVGSDKQEHYDILKDIFQPIVNLIRSNGANNILWIPGSGWQSQYWGYANNPIEGENIGYAVHTYPGYWGGTYNYEVFKANWDKNVKPVADIAPIVVTEIDWAPESYDATWGKGITGIAGQGNSFGANFKKIVDDTGNVSWNLLGPDGLLHHGLPEGDIAFDNDPEACANACYNWFREYAENSALAVDEMLLNEKVNVFPNPSNSVFTISSGKGFDEIKISTLDGRSIFSNKMQSKTSQYQVKACLKTGIYFLTVSASGQKVMGIKKIVIQ